MKKAIIYKAGELYKLGYNSSQAVCGALAGYYGLDQETAFKMASSFGDGTSRMEGTCGAADALVIMAGFEKDTSIPGDLKTREENYRMVRDLVSEFKKNTGPYFAPNSTAKAKNAGKSVKNWSKAQRKFTRITWDGNKRPSRDWSRRGILRSLQAPCPEK